MTAQAPEILMLDGKSLRLCSLPLEPLLERAGIDLGWGGSSSCWRGYIGKWELRGERLYLLEVNRFPEPSIELMSRIFPGASEHVFAYWFSGKLRIPKGEMLDYRHIGFASTYESGLLLTIENGLLINRTVHKNQKSESGDGPRGFGMRDAHSTPPTGLMNTLLNRLKYLARR